MKELVDEGKCTGDPHHFLSKVRTLLLAPTQFPGYFDPGAHGAPALDDMELEVPAFLVAVEEDAKQAKDVEYASKINGLRKSLKATALVDTTSESDKSEEDEEDEKEHNGPTKKRKLVDAVGLEH